MAEMSQRQQDRINKSSSDRLRSQLVRSGMEEDEVAQMDRVELKAVAAQMEVGKQGGEDARQKPLPDNGDELFEPPEAAAPKSREYEVLRLKFQLRKMEIEAQQEARKTEADREARKAEAEARKIEAEARKVEAERKAEIEKIEAERETRKMELEMEIRMIELKAKNQGEDGESETAELQGAAAVAADHSMAGRTKKFGDALRHVLPHMPSEHAELPQFFDTVEKLFTIYQVPTDVQAKLLIPILSTQAKTIIGRMTSDDLMSYDKVKQFLLTEFRLTPKEYKVRFDTASKSVNETYVLFASRLGNLLTYYLRSRGVEDVETLCELLVSDKLKTCLPPGTLNYVLSLEGDDWFGPSKVAGLADTYAANHDNRYGQNQSQKYRPSSGNMFTKSQAKNAGEQPLGQSYGRGRGLYGEQPPLQSQSRGRGNYGPHHPGRGRGNPSRNPAEQRCYACQSLGHLSYNCPNRPSGSSDKSSNQATSGRAQVNCSSTVQRVSECVERVLANECTVPSDESVRESVWEYGEFPVVETSAVCAPTQGTVKISPLRFAEVVVNEKAARALKDSGAQIPLISQELAQEIPSDNMGRIMIDGVVGSALVPLTNVGIQLAAENGTVNLCAAELPVVCGVVDLSDKEYDVILPSNVVKELQQMPVVSVVVAECASASDGVNVSADVLNDQVLSASENVSDDDVTNAEFCNISTQNDESVSDDAGRLRDEQQQDETLTDCWSLARQGKSNFVVSPSTLSLLYSKPRFAVS